MAYYYDEPSRTFNEFLLVPNLTRKSCTPGDISLESPMVKYKKNEKPALSVNIPFASAIMQSVSDDKLAVALAKCGGISFIYCSQPIDKQVEMISKVKRHKAGFVVSDSNLMPDNTLKDVLAVEERTGHSTLAVTHDGSPTGKLLGIVTSRDYIISKDSIDKKVKDFMTPFSSLIYARQGVTLSEANTIIWTNKLNCLPIVDDRQNLVCFVFRKDYIAHKENPNELLDRDKRYVVGAGINTRDYRERVPALIDAGADILCIDSSDGYSEWARDTVQYVKGKYGDAVRIGAGNVVDQEGFMYLAESGADFVKVGIGGGAICITREQKGIGRGQATALIDVARARDEYARRTGIIVPICSDGGIVFDYHITLALAMGANFVMMGRYFARFDESPTKKLRLGNNYVKEYWGEGSNRARNWQRYNDEGEGHNLLFEEGVDSYVPYAGGLRENLNLTISKIKSTMSNCGAGTIEQLQRLARITPVSQMSLVEGGAHDVILKDISGSDQKR